MDLAVNSIHLPLLRILTAFCCNAISNSCNPTYLITNNILEINKFIVFKISRIKLAINKANGNCQIHNLFADFLLIKVINPLQNTLHYFAIKFQFIKNLLQVIHALYPKI